MSCNLKKKTELKTIVDSKLIFNNEDRENRMKELEYLKNNVFKQLENLNDGFDSELIYYFSKSDFEIVLNRVEKLGIGIIGIEPWLNGEFYDVKVVEQYNTISNDPKWYRKAFEEFIIDKKNLQYAASYEIPKELLTE